MSKALYRKYRSKSLEEVVGQDHITDILKRSLKKGVIAHAYLLTGPRGVGKTSIARILAHEINELEYTDESNHLDIIEIDAASNNGVDDVRELRDKVQLAPSTARKKIYIIDEVHMLSKPAFNALLKTLEEPPEHVVFVLATTDIDKLPATIISRTQRFTFRPVPVETATKHLKMIAEKENINIDISALELIARRGQGSFRDSISLLDQLTGISGSEPITAAMVADSLGLAPSESVAGLIDSVEKKDVANIVLLVERCQDAGVDLSALVVELASEVKSRLVSSPGLATLLGNLLEVTKSSDPYLKLIAVLASHNLKLTPKTAALTAPSPSVSAPVKELQNAAAKAKPEVHHVPPKPQTKPTTTNDIIDTAATIAINSDAPVDLDWQALIEYTRQKYVALYSVIAKCSHEISGDQLKIYTGNAFYKKKLDDSKYRLLLSQALGQVCQTEFSVETVSTKAPPKDEQAAAVAAIMGGGEEVSVDI